MPRGSLQLRDNGAVGQNPNGSAAQSGESNACCCGDTPTSCCSDTPCADGHIGRCSDGEDCTPSTVRVVFEDVSVIDGDCRFCDEICEATQEGGYVQVTGLSSFSGSFCLEQLPGQPCRYEYSGPYTDIVVKIWETAGCTGDLLAITTRIQISVDYTSGKVTVRLDGPDIHIPECTAPYFYLFDSGAGNIFASCESQVWDNATYIEPCPTLLGNGGDVSWIGEDGTATVTPCCEEGI